MVRTSVLARVEDRLSDVIDQIEVHTSGTVVSATLLTTAILIVDLLVPLGISVYVLYSVPFIMFALVAPRLLGWVLGSFIVLVMAGFLLSVPGPVRPEIVLLNRGIFSLSLLPITGLVVLILREREHLFAENARRRQAEASLRTANEKLQLLSSITRHDINNRLAVVRGGLDLLRDTEDDPDQVRALEAIAKETDRAASLVRFTAEYQSIGVDLPCWQDLGALVRSAERNVSLGSVRVENECPPGTQVFADALIERVFSNLVENAVRYGETITTFRFSFLREGDLRVIVCSDDGVGIPDEDKRRIFERGFGRNTGFGLFLSREILAITGIEIRETGRPGEGARFELLVPPEMFRESPVLPGSEAT